MVRVDVEISIRCNESKEISLHYGSSRYNNYTVFYAFVIIMQSLCIYDKSLYIRFNVNLFVDVFMSYQ